MINNIKSSLTLLCKKGWGELLIKNTSENNFTSKISGNILVIKTDFCRLCIIEKITNKKLDGDYTSSIHVNITGVRDLVSQCKIITSLREKLFSPDFFKIVGFKIDNITASFNLGCKIPLHEIKAVHKNCKYNREKFPALFYKHANGTALIFASGKVNIVGCKKESHINEIWLRVKEMTLNVCI